MATVLDKAAPVDWWGEDDAEGYRESHVVFRVRSNSRFDGPSVVRTTPGLPVPGSLYAYGNDNDPWAWCRRNRSIKKDQDNPKGSSLYWLVECVFSNRPPDSRNESQRDPANAFDNPLAEQHRISISSIKDREQAITDRFGKALLMSSHEPMSGPRLDFDIGRASVRVEQNVVNLEAALIESLMNTVNASTLWGLPKRCVKLSSWGAEKKYYKNFLPYWTRHFELETDRRTFDRFVPDVGSKMLMGEYNAQTGVYTVATINGQPANPNNPAHFIGAKQRDGSAGKVLLNGRGVPALTTLTKEGYSISVADNNTGNALSDNDWWVPFIGDWGDYDLLEEYWMGSVVTFNGAKYVALSLAEAGLSPLAAGDLWQVLPNGVVASGDYSEATTYSIGHRVRDTEQIGLYYHKVQKYAESNLLLLGIPAVLF